MFTGIVQTTGRVAELIQQPSGLRLVVDVGGWRPEEGRPVIAGDSICVSGVCLTVAAIDGDRLGFDVIPETLQRSTLGRLGPGDPVNLEPAVTASQPLGGHFMQGHVDGIGTVTAVVSEGAEWRIRVRPPAELAASMIPKGSVALDGVSLTLAAVDDREFEVALIPTTLDRTTLRALGPGDPVNIEADILAKTTVATVRRMLGAAGEKSGAVTMDLLRRAGFVGDGGPDQQGAGVARAPGAVPGSG